MLRISKNASVTISIVLSSLFCAVLLAAAFILPDFVHMIASAALHPLGLRDGIFVLVSGYGILLFALLAAVMLIRLLLLVRSGRVFTAMAVSLIRGVSWCAFAISAIFLAMTWYYLVALVLAFTAVLLGLCLRVVKNVIEEATEIKSENDLTV
ncbi:MAG: DUF2975 domain-containing protein [Oscillospiraceae bacterium]|nr:DUF2975 domain-containing protein [Oscillospiraceae bacterium]